MEKATENMLERVAMKELLASMNPKDVRIVTMSISFYLKSMNTLFIPAEIGLTAFSIQDGIIDNYWSMIDPYCVPLGFGFSVRTTAEKINMPVPPFSNLFQNYQRTISGLEAFIKKHENPDTKTTIVFCFKDDVKAFNGGLTWLYDQIGKQHQITLMSIGDVVQQLSNYGIMLRSFREATPFGILLAKYMNYDRFFIVMEEPARQDTKKAEVKSRGSITSSGYGSNDGDRKSNGVDNAVQQVSNSSSLGLEHNYKSRLLHPARGFHNGEEVEKYLKSQELYFDSELACLHHMKPANDAMKSCPLHVTNRNAYCILASLINHYGIRPIRGVNTYDKTYPLGEEVRRIKFLKEWGYCTFSCTHFTYDGTPPRQFSTRLADAIYSRKGRPA